MKLEHLGKVTHGATLSRIEAGSNKEFKNFQLFTMQNLSRETGHYGIVNENQEIKVDINKLNDDFLSKKGLVVIGLTSYKAMVIEENHIGKIIPSNFATVEFDSKKIDPYYFTWFFNEHPKVQKQLTIAMQGSIIRALSVQMLRELDVPIISIELQKKIGIVYKLKKRKEKLLFNKNILEDKMYKQQILNILEEEL